MADARKITAVDIKAALSRIYTQPEWAILFEVGDATGGRHTRFADALAMSLWPSRGLELHGFEIKVSKWDWQNERRRPEKAETIAAYCDRWWLVTAPGVAEATEIPPAWGWMEFAAQGDLLKTSVPALIKRKEAEKTPAKEISRLFLAALLRRADKMDSAAIDAELQRRDAERKEQFDERVRQAVDARTSYGDSLVKDVEAFEKASGIKICDQNYLGIFHDAEATGRAVQAVLKSGIDATWGGLQRRASDLRESADKIEAGLREMGFEPRPQSDAAKRRRRSVA